MAQHHAVFLHHGLWGNSTHVHFIIQKLVEKAERVPNALPLLIGNCNVNHSLLTYDGIDIAGERFVQYVLEYVQEQEEAGKKIAQVSFIGYSLGGNIARYAIGKLHTLDFFTTRVPMNFITLATPHLGISKPAGSAFNFIYNQASSVMIRKTGQQLTLSDEFIDSLPLFVVMADPRFCFHKALQLFKNKCLFANTRNDFMVRYTTASISYSNPYRKHDYEPLFPTTYPSIVGASKLPLPKEPWTWQDAKMVGLLSLFSCVALPIILVLLPTTALYHYMTFRVSHLYHAHWLKQHYSEHVQLDDDNPDTQGLVSPSSDIPLHDKKALRKWMVSSLQNQLDWRRVDVCLKRTNAHAAIIVRRNNLMDHQDVVLYLVDHVFLFV